MKLGMPFGCASDFRRRMMPGEFFCGMLPITRKPPLR
jgi:hypothetical protein